MASETEDSGGAGTAMIEILLIEDSPGDVRLTREALKDAKIINNLNVMPDGVEAMDYLRRKGKYATAKEPQLILLDLNLPKKNGREVLNEIKSDPQLKHIPVVILTTSNDEHEVLQSYQLHANCFITKPVDFPQFLNVIKAIKGFWVSIVNLPHREKEIKTDE
jgi:CheY-like chemotaxis protein